MVMVGGLRSTLYGPYGPATTELPATSVTVLEDVGAAPSAAPAATDVASANVAGDVVARPDPPSSAVHGTLTLAAYHGEVVGGVQLTVGAFRSILKVSGPPVVQLPATSQSCAVFVSAEAVSVPAATVVDNVNVVRVARPDTASDAVHVTDWLAPYHLVRSAVQLNVGGVRSTFTVIVASAARLPAASVAL